MAAESKDDIFAAPAGLATQFLKLVLGMAGGSADDVR